MRDGRRRSLLEALLRAGVRRRYAGRAVQEIDDHHRQLVDGARAAALSNEDAQVQAETRLGADRDLVEHFVAQPELRAWSSRRPVLCFTVIPLLCFIVLCLAAAAVLWVLSEMLSSTLHRVRITAEVSRRIELAMQVFFLWALPFSTAAGFAVLAYRQRIGLKWPAVGIVLLCFICSLINVDLVLTGGADPGQAGAGIGISAESLPGQAAHALVLATSVLVPLRWAARRLGRDLAAMG